MKIGMNPKISHREIRVKQQLYVGEKTKKVCASGRVVAIIYDLWLVEKNEKREVHSIC